MNQIKRSCRFKNANSHLINHSEVWLCVYSFESNLFAWSDRNGTISLINFNEFNLKDIIEKNEEKSQNQELLIDIDQIQQKITCGESVWSLAFGSSKSQVINKRLHHQHKNVNTRFKLRNILILAVGLESGKIFIYDALKCSLLFILRDHRDIVRDLKFSKNGSFQLASVSKDETIKLWDMWDDGNMYKTLDEHTGSVHSCDWSPTASLLCTVGMNRQAYLWDTETYKIKHILKGHMNEVINCEFSLDGALLATASYDTKIFIWNPYTGILMKQFYHLLPPPRPIFASGHNGSYVRAIKFNPTGTNLVSLCDDKKIRIWSSISRTQMIIGESTQSDALSCAYSSDGEFIFIGTRSGYIDVYRAPRTGVDKLVDISRRMVNQLVERKNIGKLSLPKDLENFLCYSDQQLHQSSISTLLPKNNLKINNVHNVTCY